MTDPRMGDELFDAVRALPEGAGIVFRHGELNRAERLRLGLAVARAAARRGLVLGVAGDVALARQLGASLVHNPGQHPGLMPHSRSVHNEVEAEAACRAGAALAFVSPVFPTRSHPGRVALGDIEAARLARIAGGGAIALGGMDEERFAALRGPFHGYAGIDCWLGG